MHERPDFTAFIETLPAVTLHEQWDALVAKVGGKVFCLLGDESCDIVFKVSEIAFDGLMQVEGIAQAPYFAKRRWVRVAAGALESELLGRYIEELHRIVSAGLTRRLRAELGLS